MANSGLSSGAKAGKDGHRLRSGVLLILWTAAALAFLIIYIADLQASLPMLSAPCQGIGCHYQAIGSAEAAVLAAIGLSVSAYATYILGITVLTVAIYVILALLLLKWLYPKPLGFLFSLMTIVIPTTSITSFDVVAAAYPTWEIVIWLVAAAGFAIQGLFYITFPNGRLKPRLSIIIPILWPITFLLSTQATFVVQRDAGPLIPDALLITAFMLIIAGLVATIIYRYQRVFDRRERQQAKWVVFGLFVLMLGFPVWGYTYVWSTPAPGQSTLLTLVLGWTLTQVVSLVLPVTIFLAMTRSRLWDIDIVVRKTLVYGVVSAALVAVYLGSVVVLQSLLTGLTGQGSPVAIVISTLLIAALFNPLRGRVQTFIDRRFYRSRYDAARTLARFNAIVRDEVAVDALTHELVRAVDSTMQPVAISIWLKSTLKQ